MKYALLTDRQAGVISEGYGDEETARRAMPTALMQARD